MCASGRVYVCVCVCMRACVRACERVQRSVCQLFGNSSSLLMFFLIETVGASSVDNLFIASTVSMSFVD